MRVEFRRNSREEDRESDATLMVTVTVENNDRVTPGSQYAQEFSLNDLRELSLSEVEEEDQKPVDAEDEPQLLSDSEENGADEAAAENEGLAVSESDNDARNE